MESTGLERITSAELSECPWQYESDHIRTTIDAFGMTGNKKISIRLKLSMRASLLLEEEFPDAIPGIRKEDGDCYWEGEVSSLKSIGRFVMGLIDEIDILHPPALAQYISKKAKKFSTPTPIVESRE
jgi:proteasome accessory factor C